MITPEFWPAPEAFPALAERTQLTDNKGRCTGLAICNDAGQPTPQFAQGEMAHFYYEFEVLGEIGVPCVGLEFHDTTGQVIYGKTTFQRELQDTHQVQIGQRLRVHHAVRLDVAPGNYSVTVGLASLDEASYAEFRQGRLPHPQLADLIRAHCRVQNSGNFSVGWAAGDRLLHYGIANLPDLIDVTAHQPVGPAVVRPVAPVSTPGAPTIFHVTHWKAGSQWIHRILIACVPELIVPPQSGESQFLHWPLQPGKVYPTVYVTKQQFDQVHLPAGARRFVVIRDLRDTLVSWYFSLKHSHPLTTAQLAEERFALQKLSMEDGLLYLMDKWLGLSAQIQLSWQEAGEPLIRYEDLLTQDTTILERVLLDECQLPVSRQRLQEVILANRFASLTRTRQRGEEDIAAHERKGIAGDWQNHFTDRVKRAFKARYGGILIATGYATDLSW